MTTPDTTTPEAAVDENAAATATKVVETEPAASEVTSEAKAGTEASVAEAQAVATETPVAATPAEAVTEAAVAVATPASTETAVVVPATSAEAVEEDPQTTVFSLLTFFLAALPVIGVILNAIAVARAGKEGFDLWLARWGLALAIIETIGALALVGLGYYLGMLTAGTV
ncbi:hypothetical protein APR04_005890 [Promicromonospora umidemergens]|uniref:Interferon-induced transmembrane protein n=1 Tax=Promicromonospora umidemergens TaxID=629679 RepID=A0ABP8WJX2_9MICO|nr:hypothetical protein [Promicromonospora umidemergens]MCP2286943.1 hypothetical protein [Promicromonospora umidemergens]